MSPGEPSDRVRAPTGMLVVVAILVAFLYQLVHAGEVTPWLALVVAVLGVAAGVALLGRSAVRMAAAIVRGTSRREER